MYLELHGHYANGFLWRQGGIAEQAYRYLQAMLVIEAELQRIARERERDRERARGSQR
jgi:hypothetical protein